jgi:hypothetical protein
VFVEDRRTWSERNDGKPVLRNRGRPKIDTDPLMRHCRRHGFTEFAIYGRKDPRARCKRCVGEAVNAAPPKVRALLVDEAGGRCAVCGYDRCLFNLHFHHVDPTTKSFRLDMGRSKSLAAFRAEARKCVLVCANCHGEIEAGLIPSPPPGAQYQPRARRAA